MRGYDESLPQVLRWDGRRGSGQQLLAWQLALTVMGAYDPIVSKVAPNPYTRHAISYEVGKNDVCFVLNYARHEFVRVHVMRDWPHRGLRLLLHELAWAYAAHRGEVRPELVRLRGEYMAMCDQSELGRYADIDMGPVGKVV